VKRAWHVEHDADQHVSKANQGKDYEAGYQTSACSEPVPARVTSSRLCVHRFAAHRTNRRDVLLHGARLRDAPPCVNSASAHYALSWPVRAPNCTAVVPKILSDDRESDQAGRTRTPTCVADSSTCATRARQPPSPYAPLCLDCRRRSSSRYHPKLVPLFNESGKLVPTSHRWGHLHQRARLRPGLFLSPSAAGQGDLIFAYGGVAVANAAGSRAPRTAGQVPGQASLTPSGKHRRFCGRRGFLRRDSQRCRSGRARRRRA